MAVYTNDLRLKEIATGDESGTWGTSTNTNLSLIADAFGFGTEAITTNADTHTTTIADGSADPGRSIFLKYTGTLDSACTITIGPNTVSKLWLIENATSGSQNIIIKQGSGATVTIANGQTKAIYSDGAGSGGAMVDAFQDLSIPDLFIDDDLTFTSDSAVITFGADGDTTLTHTDGSGLTLNSTNKLMFNDASQFIQGSSATVLSLGATDEIDLTATLIDINGNADVSGTVTATGTSVFASLDISGDIDVDGTTNLDVVDIDGAVDMASTLQVDGAITSSAGATITVADNSNALSLVSTDADASAGPNLLLYRNSSSPADSDELGNIFFQGRNDNSQDVIYATIETFALDVSDGTEDAVLNFNVMKAGSSVSFFKGNNTEVVVNDDSNDLDFRVESDSKTHALFVDAGNNQVLFNTETARSTSGVTSALQQHGTNFGNSSFSLICDSNSASTAPIIFLAKSRGSAGGSTVVQSGDRLGGIFFNGADGTDIENAAASIQVLVDATPGSNDMPGRIVFFTTQDGSASNTERWRINNVGVLTSGGNSAVGIGGTPADANYAELGAGYLNLNRDDTADAHQIQFGKNGAVHSRLETTSAGLNLQTVTGLDVVVNEDSVSGGLRVESNGQSHMFVVNGASDIVKIGTSGTSVGNSYILECAGAVPALFRATSTASSATYGGVALQRDHSGNGQGTGLGFAMNDDAGNVTEYSYIGTIIKDAANGSEDGEVVIMNTVAASTRQESARFGRDETVMNENARDLDFRVESSGFTHQLYVDAGNNTVGIGASTPSATLEVASSSSGALNALTVYNSSDNTNAAVQMNFALERVGSAVEIVGGRIKVAKDQQWTTTASTVDATMSFDCVLNESLVNRMNIGGLTGVQIPFINNSYNFRVYAQDADSFFGIRDTDNDSVFLQIDRSDGLTVFTFDGHTGNLVINGSISKGSGSFKIDHPLPAKKETHHLVHSFVEAPQADNIYRGSVDLVDGSATVNLDTAARMTEGTFVLLNTNLQCFTSNESGWTAVKGSISGNTLTITAQDNTCTDTISWIVVGERQDEHMKETDWTDSDGRVIVEPEKITEGE